MTAVPRRRLRSAHVGLGLTVMAAAALTGCAADEPDYAAICVDPITEERIDDDLCDDSDDPSDYHGSGGGFFWFYVNTSSSHPIPAVGSRFNPGHGTYTGSTLTRGGKTVQRGGMPEAGSPSVRSFTKSGGFGSTRGVSSS